ncbi:Aspartyl/asparaginyl beta-hydroxylase [Nymphon striatum]|nr:Aspartyl/asparaginyl beta-hydroxylase [Nymphon striatum]
MTTLPVLFNLYLERIMADALANYAGRLRCASLEVTDLRFADDIDLMEESEKGSWKEGKVIMFDDSYEHEVWHSGDTPRLILISHCICFRMLYGAANIQFSKIRGSTIKNLRYANDDVLTAGSMDELQTLVYKVNEASVRATAVQP